MKDTQVAVTKETLGKVGVLRRRTMWQVARGPYSHLKYALAYARTNSTAEMMGISPSVALDLEIEVCASEVSE